MKHIKGLVLVSVLLFLTGCKISINSNNSIEVDDNTGDNNIENLDFAASDKYIQ